MEHEDDITKQDGPLPHPTVFGCLLAYTPCLAFCQGLEGCKKRGKMGIDEAVRMPFIRSCSQAHRIQTPHLVRCRMVDHNGAALAKGTSGKDALIGVLLRIAS